MNNTNDKPHTSLATVTPSIDWEITTCGAQRLQHSDQMKHLDLGLCMWFSPREQGASAAVTVNGDEADSL